MSAIVTRIQLYAALLTASGAIVAAMINDGRLDEGGKAKAQARLAAVLEKCGGVCGR